MADTYAVIIFRPAGIENWNWPEVDTAKAQAVWELLGPPDYVEGIGAAGSRPQARHGETNPQEEP